MSASHTPGPWRANGHQIGIANGFGLSVAIVYSPALDRAPKTEAEREANARLIAAAPELLEALKMAVRQNGCDMFMTGEELRRCESAIAKATGSAT